VNRFKTHPPDDSSCTKIQFIHSIFIVLNRSSSVGFASCESESQPKKRCC